ncbi:MAG: hypothetical protein V3U75_12755 [Methylococcaceae bacterium]
MEEETVFYNRDSWNWKYYCKKCKTEVAVIKQKDKWSTHKDERGTLDTSWVDATFKCPKCGATENHNINYKEEDGSFYSMSQPDG